MEAPKIIKPQPHKNDIAAPKIPDVRQEEKEANKLWTPSDFEAVDKLISKYTPAGNDKGH